MGEEKFEKFSTVQLKRRKKVGSIITIVLFVFGFLSLLLAVYQYISDKNFNNYLIVTALACFFMAIIFFTGIKSTRNEIARRKDT